MRTLTLDIETDGLLDECSEMHMCYVSIDGGEPQDYNDRELDLLFERTSGTHVLVGHNILGFDLPAIDKLWSIKWEGATWDTMLASQIAYSDIRLITEKTPWLFPKVDLPGNLMGSHSLKAWGLRLGNSKGDYEGAWVNPTPEELEAMHDYCKQDVLLTYDLYKFLVASERIPAAALDLEQKVKRIIMTQTANGFQLDVEACEALYLSLLPKRNALKQELQEAFGDVLKRGKLFVPKRDNKRHGYKAGVEVQKLEFVEFNPGSGQHIVLKLKEKYGWVPVKFTDKGQPRTDGETLGDLPYPEAKLLKTSADVNKILGYVSEGDNAWLKLVGDDGRLHGEVRTMGCVTSRMSHNSPNLGQIPKGGEMGKACRKCFIVSPGKVLVGADASGLELRCLAHYLYNLDGGEYAKEILDGDIHTANMVSAGLSTRDQAKTFIYAWIYGAGNAKIGSIIGKGAGAGAKLKKSFLTANPAIDTLKKAVSKKVKQSGSLRAIDGRIVPIRADYAAMNFLLQGCGALIMKHALVITDEKLQVLDGWRFVANVHDEIQVECDPEDADLIGGIMVESMRAAGKKLGIRMDIDGEYKVGKNWSETH